MQQTFQIGDFIEQSKSEIDAIISKYLPQTFDQKYLEWVFGKASYAYDVEALNKTLAEPIHEFLSRGGKRWRPALFLLITRALGGDVDKVKDFVIAVELLHDASLIIDDVEDDADLRRGKPCLHKIFGVDIALNVAGFLSLLPLAVLIKSEGKFTRETISRAYWACLEELTAMHAGQASDIAWHRDSAKFHQLTETEYLQMCANKTGSLPRLAARLAVILTEGSEKQEQAFARFGQSIGVAFQIRDDVDDILSPPPDTTPAREWGEDISEGRCTLAIIHAMRMADSDDRQRLAKILRMHTKDESLVREAIEIIRKYGSLEYATDLAHQLTHEAWQEVASLLRDSESKTMLREFVDLIIEKGSQSTG